MRVFLAPADATVTPLDAPARDARVLGRTLGEAMRYELGAAGLEVATCASIEEGEARARAEANGAFVLLDSVFATRQAVRRFVAAARRSSGDGARVLALPRGLLSDELSHVGGLDAATSPDGSAAWTAPFHFVRGASASIARATPLVLPYREHRMVFPLPPGLLGRAEEVIGIGETFACNVSHWVHVLRVNTKSIAGWWFDRLRFGGVIGPMWIAWRALLGLPWLGGRFLESMRSVAWSAQVHHRALVEMSVVGRGAIIGAKATVKNAFIGAGARVGEGANVMGTVVGEGAFVAGNSTVLGSVVYPGAFASQALMQLSILGRDACALASSNFFDLNFARSVRVPHRGAMVDSGAQFLGVCVGPKARIGGGVWVASGRESRRARSS